MRVLASVLLGATAVSATATKTAKNSGFTTKTAVEERAAAVTQCLTDIKAVLDLNKPSANQLTLAQLRPTAGNVAIKDASTDPIETSPAMTANALGVYGGLCGDTDVGADTAGASPNVVTYVASTKPTLAKLTSCVGQQGTSSDGLAISDDQVEKIMGETNCAATDAPKGICHLPIATSAASGKVNLAAEADVGSLKQFGCKATNCAGGFMGSEDSTDASTLTGTELQVFKAKTATSGGVANKNHAVTADDIQKVLALHQGACYTVFKQEQVLDAVVTKASATASLSVATVAAPEVAEIKQARELGFLHVGVLANQLTHAYFKAMTAPQTLTNFVGGSTATDIWPATSNAVVNTAGAGVSTAVALPKASYKDHPCNVALMALWAANGAMGATVTTTGVADTASVLEATDLYACSAEGSTADPCDVKGPTIAGTSTAQPWGEWSAGSGPANSLIANNWGMPLKPELAGSTMFSLSYDTVDVPADGTAYASTDCSGYTVKANAGTGNLASEHRCTLSVVPAALKALHPALQIGTVIEVTSDATTKTFQAKGTVPTDNTELRADLLGGTTLRIISTLTKAAGVYYKYTKKAGLNPGDAATCGVVRTSAAAMLAARCDVSEGLINTLNAGGINNAFAVAYGKATKHLKPTASAADGTVTKSMMGILPQIAADCGFETENVCAEGKGGAQASACTHCAKGKYSAVTTLTACSDCDAGKYSDETGNSASAHCKTCPKGKWSAKAASSCTLCAAGTYGDATGLSASAACKNCTSGSTTAGAIASANCSSTVPDATTKASGALSRFSALAITSLLALIAM